MSDPYKQLNKHLRAERAKRIFKIAIIPVIALGLVFPIVLDQGVSGDPEIIEGTITGFRSLSLEDGTQHYFVIKLDEGVVAIVGTYNTDPRLVGKHVILERRTTSFLGSAKYKVVKIPEATDPKAALTRP